MNPFKKLFRPNTPATPAPSESPAAETGAAAPQPDAPASDPATDPNMMRVFDAQGRERFITRDEWREKMLRPQLERVWNDPEHLYATIAKSLTDGFLADMVEPAEQLAAIDTLPERGAVVLAVVYRESKRLDDSERVLRAQIEKHGESAITLVHLAKLEADRGAFDVAVQGFQRALGLDANQPEGLQWYCSIIREKSGEPAALEALRQIAGVPGSWRPQLWLARDALGRKELAEALAIYREAISRAGAPAPVDLLVQMTGDLGSTGHPAELLELAGPLFNVKAHGLVAADNLLRACIDVAAFNAFRGLLDLLYAEKRNDWRQRLGYWDAVLGRARAAVASANQKGPRTIAMVVDDGPVWMLPLTQVGELLPESAGETVSIAFLGSTVESPADPNQDPQRVADAAGRLSRALPLFLAEQAYFNGNARVRPLVPWVVGEFPAFAVGNDPWNNPEAAERARSLEPACQYSVVTHLEALSEPWRVDLRLVRAADGVVVGAAAVEFKLADLEGAVRELAAELLKLLEQKAGVVPKPAPAAYAVPSGPVFGLYFMLLEQLLAVRCHTLPDVPVDYLHGERGVVDSCFQFCHAEQANVLPRLLLVQVLRRLRAVRPQVVEEYREIVANMQAQAPLAEPAQSIVAKLFAEIYP